MHRHSTLGSDSLAEMTLQVVGLRFSWDDWGARSGALKDRKVQSNALYDKICQLHDNERFSFIMDDMDMPGGLCQKFKRPWNAVWVGKIQKPKTLGSQTLKHSRRVRLKAPIPTPLFHKIKKWFESSLSANGLTCLQFDDNFGPSMKCRNTLLFVASFLSKAAKWKKT